MNGIAPLLYLETRLAAHKLRAVLRQPARLTLWVVFGAWFGAFLLTRMQRVPGGHYGLVVPDGTQTLLVFVPVLYALIIGMQIQAGIRRPPAAFAYPADARFLLGSHLSHATVVFWLQLREAAFQGIRLFVGLFFLSWNFAASAGGFLHASIVLLSAYVVVSCLRLPVFLVQRRFPTLPFAWLGAGCLAGGALAIGYPIALAFASHRLNLGFIAAHTPTFPPGTWIVAGLAGNQSAALALAFVACSIVLAGSLAASDAYPEIWEASSRQYAWRSLVASGRGLWNREPWRAIEDGDPCLRHAAPAPIVSLSGDRAPTRALSLLWREWIALRRSSGGLRWPLFWVTVASVCGALGGLAAHGRAIVDLLAPLVAVANIVIIIGSQSAVSLGSELRRPMFWLGDSRLRDRILAWMASAMLRVAPPLTAGLLMAGIATHSWPLAAAAAPIVIVGLFLVQSIGVASYVALPGRHDLRGPGFMLRIFTTYTALALPALAWGFVQVVSHDALLGISVGLGVAFLEGWTLLSFSASRLEENAMVYAAAEEH